MAHKVRKGFLKSKPKGSPVQVVERQELIGSINALASSWRDRLKRWPSARGKKVTDDQRPITLVSDCSGYGSDLIALHLLGIHNRIRLPILTEVDSGKIEMHKVVARVCGVDTSTTRICDIFNREIEKCPSADLYIAGYPCPSFQNWARRRELLTVEVL